MADNSDLNTEQLRAVTSNSNALVVVAGAGSGKTEVITRRIERLLENGPSDGFKVLAVSYTVKAADELQQRLRDRLGPVHARVTAETLHGFALSVLRQHGTRIGLPLEPEVLAQADDRLDLFNTWREAEGLEPVTYPDLQALDLKRAKCEESELLDMWRTALSEAGALDYPAMLERARELLELHPRVGRTLRDIYEHVVVDEAQNLSEAQYRLLRLVVGEPSSAHSNAMLVGDERQSIIKFAGADPGLISKFESEFEAERIELIVNYRSAQAIARVAANVSVGLASPGSDDPQVDYAAPGSVSVEALRNEMTEANFVADWIESLTSEGVPSSVTGTGTSRRLQLEEIAVLGRSASTLRAVQGELDSRGIAFSMGVGDEDWLATNAARVAMELIRYKASPHHQSTCRHIRKLCGADDLVNVEDAVGNAQDDQIRQLACLLPEADLSQLIGRLLRLPCITEDLEPDWISDLELISEAWDSFIDRSPAHHRTPIYFQQFVARFQRGEPNAEGARLLTVHKAQGREFAAVAVVGMNDGQFPDFRANDDESILDELRCFYVATTRPSRVLLLTRARVRPTKYGLRQTEPSRFLDFVSS